MIPPHLPPPSVHVHTRRMVERLKLVALTVVVALVAGGAGASMIIGWVWSGVKPGTTILSYSLNGDRGGVTALPEPAVFPWTVFAETQAVSGGSFLSPQVIRGEALPITSDGWFVVALASSTPVSSTAWFVQSPTTLQIASFSLHSIDASRGIALGRVADHLELVRPISFVDLDAMPRTVGVVMGGYVRAASVVPYAPVSPALLTTRPAPRYRLYDPSSSPVFSLTADGGYSGFFATSGEWVSGEELERAAREFFVRTRVPYASLGVEGWFLAPANFVPNNNRATSGFLVTRLVSSTLPLRPYDVITHINNVVVDGSFSWYTFQHQLPVWNVRVVRNGNPTTLTVPRQNIFPSSTVP